MDNVNMVHLSTRVVPRVCAIISGLDNGAIPAQLGPKKPVMIEEYSPVTAMSASVIPIPIGEDQLVMTVNYNALMVDILIMHAQNALGAIILGKVMTV